MTRQDLDRLLEDDLSARRDAHQLRQRRPITPIDAVHVEIDGRRYTNFASNDYLGLTHHPRVTAAMSDVARSHGVGSGASALITGYTDEHALAERAIAQLKQTESAVLLASGHQANHAAIQTLSAAGQRGGGGARFIIDKLAHASIIDAVQASRSELRVFPHNQLAKLRRLLDDAPADQLQVVITESIFSMDGDAADLGGLSKLKSDRPFVLVLDEAHGTGVYGAQGAGYASEIGLQRIVDVSIVTLSKAIGVVGGAVCGSRTFCKSLVNHARAYIYSTSVPPAVARAARESIAVMREELQRQQRVRELARRVREALRENFEIVEGDSPIVPLIVGEERAALTAADRLRERGLLVVAVRPPTVPRGTSRLRVTLSCEHSDDEINDLVVALKSL